MKTKLRKGKMNTLGGSEYICRKCHKQMILGKCPHCGYVANGRKLSYLSHVVPESKVDNKKTE